MKLFHQISEQDQHNAIHYCLHSVIEDMLEDGVEIEPFSDEDKRRVSVLSKVIEEAKKLPVEEQFAHIAQTEDAWHFCHDIALDMARSAYYHPSEDTVIFYEDLREEIEAHEHDSFEETETELPTINPIATNKKILN